MIHPTDTSRQAGKQVSKQAHLTHTNKGDSDKKQCNKKMAYLHIFGGRHSLLQSSDNSREPSPQTVSREDYVSVLDRPDIVDQRPVVLCLCILGAKYKTKQNEPRFGFELLFLRVEQNSMEQKKRLYTSDTTFSKYSSSVEIFSTIYPTILSINIGPHGLVKSKSHGQTCSFQYMYIYIYIFLVREDNRREKWCKKLNGGREGGEIYH